MHSKTNISQKNMAQHSTTLKQIVFQEFSYFCCPPKKKYIYVVFLVFVWWNNRWNFEALFRRLEEFSPGAFWERWLVRLLVSMKGGSFPPKQENKGQFTSIYILEVGFVIEYSSFRWCTCHFVSHFWWVELIYLFPWCFILWGIPACPDLSEFKFFFVFFVFYPDWIQNGEVKNLIGFLFWWFLTKWGRWTKKQHHYLDHPGDLKNHQVTSKTNPQTSFAGTLGAISGPANGCRPELESKGEVMKVLATIPGWCLPSGLGLGARCYLSNTKTVAVSNVLNIFIPKFGKWSNLTSIFFRFSWAELEKSLEKHMAILKNIWFGKEIRHLRHSLQCLMVQFEHELLEVEVTWSFFHLLPFSIPNIQNYFFCCQTQWSHHQAVPVVPQQPRWSSHHPSDSSPASGP